MKRIRKILTIVGSSLFVLTIVLGALGAWFVRRPWPETNGTLAVAGLAAPVDIIRDQWGVPHIYAQNDHDLFFAQGYSQAQDRLWQMDFNRRLVNGGLSAVLGARLVDTDKFMLTFGLHRAAEREWQLTDEATRSVLQAYADGVNAYIDTHRDRLPVEFTLLGVNPAPWTPVDSLTLTKYFSFSLGGNYRLEMLRASLIAAVGEATTAKLLPPYGLDKPVIVPAGVNGYAGFKQARFDKLEAVDALIGDPGPVWGSNDWVVHGSRTATGKPLLAEDTHLGLTLPSVWYEVGLHDDRFDVVGFSFPGTPTIILGHNAHIAWGVSNLNPDVQDLYLEKLDDPKTPTQYELNGEWKDIQVVTETIEIKNQAPQTLKVYITPHGPIVNQVIADILDAEPMAFHWTALQEGTSVVQAVIQLDRATNWDEFRQALSHWDYPSQNFVYADIEGNIGYQMPGKIPIRAKGHSGLVPVPGWTSDNDWQGYIPFEALPHVFNPPAGFIATANNKVVADDYPYHLSYEWDPGYRAQRITDLLAANTHVTLEDMQAIQGDTYSLPAQALAPYLLAVKPETDLEAKALEQVKAWDHNYEIDRVGASIYQAWYWFLLRNTLDDELGEDLAARYLAGQYERHGTFQVPLMIDLMSRPNDPWFDDKATPEVETRDAIAHRSLVDGLAWLKEHYGADPAQWTWGRLHTLTLIEQPLGQSGIPPLSAIFNSPTIPARGDNFAVDGASFRYNNPFSMVHGASQRQVVDLGNLQNSVAIQTTGQSGHIFNSHRLDFLTLWQNVAYHPMLFDRDSITAAAEGVLTLTPR